MDKSSLSCCFYPTGRNFYKLHVFLEHWFPNLFGDEIIFSQAAHTNPAWVASYVWKQAHRPRKVPTAEPKRRWIVSQNWQPWLKLPHCSADSNLWIFVFKSFKTTLKKWQVAEVGPLDPSNLRINNRAYFNETSSDLSIKWGGWSNFPRHDPPYSVSDWLISPHA